VRSPSSVVRRSSRHPLGGRREDSPFQSDPPLPEASPAGARMVRGAHDRWSARVLCTRRDRSRGPGPAL